jgi:hypothetical protein
LEKNLPARHPPAFSSGHISNITRCSNDCINSEDGIFQAQVAGMHCDYQDWPLKSYPVDPVIRSKWALALVLIHIGCFGIMSTRPKKYIKMLINLLLFFTASNP